MSWSTKHWILLLINAYVGLKAFGIIFFLFPEPQSSYSSLIIDNSGFISIIILSRSI